MEQARQRIRENFLIYQGPKRKGIIAEFQFTILRNGTIKDIKLVKSTGDSRLDSLAYQALIVTERLMPLPAGIRSNELTVRVTFNYEL
jgi:TonB family protein